MPVSAGGYNAGVAAICAAGVRPAAMVKAVPPRKSRRVMGDIRNANTTRRAWHQTGLTGQCPQRAPIQTGHSIAIKSDGNFPASPQKRTPSQIRTRGCSQFVASRLRLLELSGQGVSGDGVAAQPG